MKLVSMDNLKYGTLRGAMIDLLKDPFEVTTQNEVIDDMVIERLEKDGTLFNEAQSMILAQGFKYLNLNDAVNIINRRIVN